MKIALKIFIFSTLISLTWINHAWANSYIDLATTQTLVNDEVIYNEIQNEAKNDELSQGTLKLLSENSALKANLNEIEQNALKNCDDGDKKKPKKTKTKSKTIEKGGWQIIASVEVDSFSPENDISVLKNTRASLDNRLRYNDLLKANNLEELQSLIKTQTESMSDEEFLFYLSDMASLLPYNKPKSEFDQDHGDTDTLFSMLSEQRKANDENYKGDDFGGVCGDIHFATSLIGETARPNSYEYFTASYVMQGSMHVYTFAVDKNNNDRAVVINYSGVQSTNNLNGVESILPHNSTGSFNNIGAEVRIFKHTGTDIENEGTSKHVATLPTAIGGFLNQVVLQDHQQTATPGYNNFNTQEIAFEKDKTKTIVKTTTDTEGNTTEKKKTLEITNGVKLIHGTLNNGGVGDTDIFSVLAYRRSARNTDQAGNVINPNQFGFESNLSAGVTHISQSHLFQDESSMLMRLNYFQGIHRNIVRTENVNIQANATSTVYGDFHLQKDQTTQQYNTPTGNMNMTTSIGVGAKYNTSKNSILTSDVRLEHTVGLTEERSMFDISQLPGNFQMTPNVLRARMDYRQRVSPKLQVSPNIEYIGTQVGGATRFGNNFIMSSTKSNNQHIISINYQKTHQGFNRDIASNLLPVRDNVSAGYRFIGKRLEGGVNLQYDIQQSSPFVNGTIKYRLNRKK